ncbi:hypothetical protein F511_34332 [Dorcoceras hygrometricum]|uniref:C2 domain-containing protein n=1 Tax=Dorcoceras hygrometricum TaxID=472368 RepID=A0A2Z7AXX7_9LAMI|nr:hypothetical protein F511_34332 [Dorcoceras hygrometricum]
MSNLKLVVEVVRAYNLVPTDGQGSTNPFVELHFDGQKLRTTIKENDLDPFWNETFYFNVSDPNDMHNHMLEAHVYSANKSAKPKSYLGKVRIAGTSFFYQSDAVLDYPLEKGGVSSSHARGELGLKVFLTDDPNIKSTIPLPDMAFRKLEEVISKWLSNSGRGVIRSAFYHLFNSKNQLPPSGISREPINYGVNNMKFQFQMPEHFGAYSVSSSQPADFMYKKIDPVLGGYQVVNGQVRGVESPFNMYDLVEPMHFLFVRVVRAHELPSSKLTGSLDPFVEVKLGNYKGVTKHCERTQNPEWNVVFTFSRERMQSSVLEVVVKDKDMLKDDIVGLIRFDLPEIPTRVPPDSPLAPVWYQLGSRKGKKKKGELLLAVWIGTQADEAFPEAWHTDSTGPDDGSGLSTHLRSKVYLSPRLWYLRVNVIEAQDLVVAQKNNVLNLLVKAQIGNQVLRTKSVESQPTKVLWNEELIFVAVEPFDDHLTLSVEDCVSPNKDEILGRIFIPLSTVDQRAGNHFVHPRWYNLQKPGSTDVGDSTKDKFSSKVHLQVCLDGGYHVLDESIHYSSDLRPTAKQLWKPPIGRLELGILSAESITPMKKVNGKGTSDIFCVAKYGQKWIRTRTIVDCLNPKYNEHYSWEVFDPATVLTVGVFDNGRTGEKTCNGYRDTNIGKVRIRISTLETNHAYIHSYPLLALHRSGVKKMGELHLAIRFSCTSMDDMMFLYLRPLLPKMHYVRPLTIAQLDNLRHHAFNIVAGQLGRAEPPLRKEVVEYMTSSDSHLWSMRRSKANFFRLMSVFSGLFTLGKWYREVCTWKNPITTVLVQVLFAMLVCFPGLILPTAFLYMSLICLGNYHSRPTQPPQMDTKLSFADAVHLDELDEEFDTFPTTCDTDLVSMRYDRLRTIAGRVQMVVGDMASQGERIQALLSWRDPGATVIFMGFCIASAFMLYTVPFRLLIISSGLYFMRHPMFRRKLPSAPLNFFKRLPTMADDML